MSLDTAQVLGRSLDEMPWLGALLERLEHFANLRFRVDVRTGTVHAKVRQPAKIAMLDARNLQWAGADSVTMKADRTHSVGGW